LHQSQLDGSGGRGRAGRSLPARALAADSRDRLHERPRLPASHRRPYFLDADALGQALQPAHSYEDLVSRLVGLETRPPANAESRSAPSDDSIPQLVGAALGPVDDSFSRVARALHDTGVLQSGASSQDVS